MTALRDSGLFDLLVPEKSRRSGSGTSSRRWRFRNGLRGRRIDRLGLDGLRNARRARPALSCRRPGPRGFGVAQVIIAGQGAQRTRGNRRRRLPAVGEMELRQRYPSCRLSAHGGASLQKRSHGRARTFIVPMSQVKLLGNWDVIGLRATGSVDYALENVFVPRESRILQTRSRRCAAVHCPGSALSDCLRSVMAPSRWASGHRVLRELAASATTAAPQGPLKDPANRVRFFHENYAIADGKMRAGRAFL